MNLINDFLKLKTQYSHDTAVLFGLFPLFTQMRNEHYELKHEVERLNKRVEELEKHNNELKEHLSRLENYVLKEAPRISACEEDICCMKELMRIAGWIEE